MKHGTNWKGRACASQETWAQSWAIWGRYNYVHERPRPSHHDSDWLELWHTGPAQCARQKSLFYTIKVDGFFANLHNMKNSNIKNIFWISWTYTHRDYLWDNLLSNKCSYRDRPMCDHTPFLSRIKVAEVTLLTFCETWNLFVATLGFHFGRLTCFFLLCANKLKLANYCLRLYEHIKSIELLLINAAAIFGCIHCHIFVIVVNSTTCNTFMRV